MLAKDLLTKPANVCTPWDSAQTAATLMKVGALALVSGIQDPLLEGIVTDRDLCIAVVAAEASSKRVIVVDAMSRVPVTGLPESSLEECLSLMRDARVGQIPIVDHRGRWVGVLTLRFVPKARPRASRRNARWRQTAGAAPGRQAKYRKLSLRRCER